MDRFLKFLRGAALVGGILATPVSALVSYYVSYKFQIAAEERIQDRENLISKANEFTSSTSALVPIIGQYIAAINADGNLAPARDALNTKMAEEILSAQHLRAIFGEDVEPKIASYQDAIASFQEELPEAKGPSEMYNWAMNLDRVLQAKDALTKSLLTTVNSKNQS